MGSHVPRHINPSVFRRGGDGNQANTAWRPAQASERSVLI
ncbi:MAG: hypothetical protein JWR14_5060 [Caballeronia sp.]|nr:hypothetical protein [Caballeronia sp.]